MRHGWQSRPLEPLHSSDLNRALDARVPSSTWGSLGAPLAHREPSRHLYEILTGRSLRESKDERKRFHRKPAVGFIAVIDGPNCHRMVSSMPTSDSSSVMSASVQMSCTARRAAASGNAGWTSPK